MVAGHIDVLDSFQGSVRARKQDSADMGVTAWRRGKEDHDPTPFGYPSRNLILYPFFEY